MSRYDGSEYGMENYYEEKYIVRSCIRLETYS
jgi:hypothetical protein